MKRLVILTLAGILACPALSVLAQEYGQSTWRTVDDIAGLPTRIAFGSCGHQDKPQPILDTVVEYQPDLFIYLGDNIYGDTRDMQVLRDKYARLGSKPEFQRLHQATTVLAIWDDHDYGWNDAGKEYEFKEPSREIFLDFWRVPETSPRRQHAGIYGSHVFRDGSRAVQVLLLDTRTFRDPLLRNSEIADGDPAFKNAYRPDPDPQKSLLGAAQWDWLEQQLRQPADLRIICSSIQFGHQYNGWESWTNLPTEQQKMVDLIRQTGARGVVFISGDVHWGEISRRNFDRLFPLYDVTASGLTEDWHNVEPNRFRVGDVVRDNHFGLIEIDWQPADPLLTLQIVGRAGTIRVRHTVPLSELSSDQP